MDFKWYTVAVYSGYENKICADIDKMKESDHNIVETFLPTKKVFKISKGKKVEATEKMFPNYVFVKMNYDRLTLDKIRTMPRVMGFVGTNPVSPQTVSESEIAKMRSDSEVSAVAEEDKLVIGDTVRIKEGHFESFNGVIEAIDVEKNILKIVITIFGRNTIVEIDPSKVEKI